MKNQNSPVANATPEAAPKIERLAYTKAELCRALSLSPVTLYRLEKDGRLRSIPGIRHKLFSVAEVNRFLAGA